MARRSSHAKSIKAILLDSPWFASCTTEFRDCVLSLGQVRHLDEGSYLFRRGDAVVGGLGCVLEGSIGFGQLSADGKLTLLSHVGVSHWFGESGLVSAGKRPFDCRILERSKLFLVERVALYEWLSRHPQHWFDVARLCSEKLRLCYGIILAAHSVRQRLAHRLLLASQDYSPVSEAPRTKIRLSQQNLSALIGVSRQSLNQELKQLEKSRIISIGYGYLELHDLAALDVLARG